MGAGVTQRLCVPIRVAKGASSFNLSPFQHLNHSIFVKHTQDLFWIPRLG